jgi:hypothetical protein
VSALRQNVIYSKPLGAIEKNIMYKISVIIILTILLLLISLKIFKINWFTLYFKYGILIYKKIIMIDKESYEYYKFIIESNLDQLNCSNNIIYRILDKQTIGFRKKNNIKIFLNYLDNYYGNIITDSSKGAIIFNGYLNFEIIFPVLMIFFGIIIILLHFINSGVSLIELILFIVFFLTIFGAIIILLYFLVKEYNFYYKKEYDRILYLIS